MKDHLTFENSFDGLNDSSDYHDESMTSSQLGLIHRFNLTRRCSKFLNHHRSQYLVSQQINQKLKNKQRQFEDASEDNYMGSFSRERILCHFWISITMLTCLANQVISTKKFIMSEDLNKRIVPIVQWSLWLPMTISNIYTLYKPKSNERILYFALLVL